MGYIKESRRTSECHDLIFATLNRLKGSYLVYDYYLLIYFAYLSEKLFPMHKVTIEK